MKVLMIDKFHQIVIKETNILPRIGDSLGCFNYKPFPVVQTVVLFMEIDYFKETHLFDEQTLELIKDIDVIVYVK